MDPFKMYRHSGLKCFVHRLEYDYVQRRGQVWCGECTDFEGCIALFETIDRRVYEIQTYVGDDRDTLYRRKGREWEAFVP